MHVHRISELLIYREIGCGRWMAGLMQNESCVWLRFREGDFSIRYTLKC